jgi:hypothetical protein
MLKTTVLAAAFVGAEAYQAALVRAPRVAAAMSAADGM